MKGIAILLMLFYHLFNQMRYVDLCDCLIYIGDVPAVYILSRAANPVAFFLVLGGYGMYKVWKKGDRHRWSRVFKLYLHFWFIMAVFVTIGHYVKPEMYPGSFLSFVVNMSSIVTVYNGEMWFLFPYVLLSLLSPWLFRLVAAIKAEYVIAVTLLIHLATSFLISRYGGSYIYARPLLYNAILIPHLMFNFMLGAMAARQRFFETIGCKLKSLAPVWANCICLGGVIVLISVSCAFKYNYFYSFLFISCALFLYYPKWVRTIFRNLGSQSMNMWMIHSWFCYHLFPAFTYSFKYPVIIFAVLIIISYLCGKLTDLILIPVERLLLTRSEMKEKPII